MSFNKVIVMLLMAGLPSVCRAQQTETTKATETSAEAWHEYYRERAAQDYQLTYSDQDLPLTLKEQRPFELDQHAGTRQDQRLVICLGK